MKLGVGNKPGISVYNDKGYVVYYTSATEITAKVVDLVNNCNVLETITIYNDISIPVKTNQIS